LKQEVEAQALSKFYSEVASDKSMFLNLYQQQTLVEEYKKASIFLFLALFIHALLFISFSLGLVNFDFSMKNEVTTSFTSPKILNINIESEKSLPKVVKKTQAAKKSLITDKTIAKKETTTKTAPKVSTTSKASPTAKNKIYASYPPLAEELEIEGSVAMKFLADKSGKVLDVKVLRSSGSKLLDNAAIKALKTAEFIPASNQSGQAVSSWGEYTINFSLTEES